MVPQVKKILFATDLTDNSRHAFGYASTLAARFDGQIVLLHVMQSLPSGIQHRLDFLAGEGTTERLRESHQKEAREILIGKRREDHRVRQALAEFYGPGGESSEWAFDTFDIVIREGDIDEEILKAAAEFKCDVIVMGSHKGILRGTAIGGTTKGVLHHAKVPVLVVPPLDKE
jgi:nucleotide-binding universal stress UspA family protein